MMKKLNMNNRYSSKLTSNALNVDFDVTSSIVAREDVVQLFTNLVIFEHGSHCEFLLDALKIQYPSFEKCQCLVPKFENNKWLTNYVTVIN